MLHLLNQGLLGHLLQAGIEGELEAQVVAVEGACRQASWQGGAIGTTPHLQGGFVALELPVAALLQPCLGHPLQVEEANNVGKELALGVDAMGIGLQV